MFGGSMLGDHPRVAYIIGQPMANVATALLVDWAVSYPAGAIGRILNAAPLVFIGWLSYSLYLWQQPFLNRAGAAWWTAFPANAILAISLALASYYIVERPSLTLRKRLEGRRRPVSAADAVLSADSAAPIAS